MSMDLVLDHCRSWLRERILEGELAPEESIAARPLMPREALGEGSSVRHDYPLRKGREFLLEATFRGERGQAFTEKPVHWIGAVSDLETLDLGKDEERALFTAGLNAVAKALGLVGGTVHCRNESLDRCARKVGERLKERLKPEERLLIVGYQPAFIEAASATLGPERVRVVDLDAANIGRTVFGIGISDGEADLERVLKEVRFALVTGSSLVNGTYGNLEKRLREARIPFVLFGTSAAAASALLGIERWCLESR
ncbi:MAG: Rossmann-like domain-containing protein [Synergistales bacterium]